MMCAPETFVYVAFVHPFVYTPFIFQVLLIAFLINYKRHPHHVNSTGIRELKTDVTTAKAMKKVKQVLG